MNLSKNQGRFKFSFAIIVFLVVIIVIFGAYSIFTSENPKEQNLQPSLTPKVLIPSKEDRIPLNQDKKQTKQSIINSAVKNRNGDLILFESTPYEIKYVPPLDIFFVIIKNEPVDQNKDAAANWFKDQGFSQNDLCDLPVRYSLFTIELKKNNPNFNLLPEKCIS